MVKRGEYCVVTPRKASDYTFKMFEVDPAALGRASRGYEPGAFEAISYTLSKDMLSIREYMADGSKSRAVFTVSVLDASGRVLVKKTQMAGFYYSGNYYTSPIVRTWIGIVPGWYHLHEVGPCTQTMTIDLGKFSPEDLRAAARFECRIEGQENPD